MAGLATTSLINSQPLAARPWGDGRPEPAGPDRVDGLGVASAEPRDGARWPV